MKDTLLVAQFEVLRAIRTWRALALIALYAVASGGATWLFVRIVWFMENALARELGVASTDTPGAMLGTLVASDAWRDALGELTGQPHLVDALIGVPPLAVFHLWFGFVAVPFFAASAAAECIAIDVQSRAIRYEAQRTGRFEIVAGRFLGQFGLTVVASLGSAAVAWIVGMTCMDGNPPLALIGWLLWYLVRTWAFGLPFVAIGVAASQLTSSPAWARVLAIGAVAASWVGFGLANLRSYDHWWTGAAADLALQLLPQGWLRGLWNPGFGWVPAATACCALGVAVLVAGYTRFARRDL